MVYRAVEKKSNMEIKKRSYVDIVTYRSFKDRALSPLGKDIDSAIELRPLRIITIKKPISTILIT